MKIFKTGEYARMENPTPGATYKPELLTQGHGAKHLGGVFGLIPPGSPGVYHYHEQRESIIIVIRGEATEIIEGKEIPVREGDVLFIPAGEKHGIVNRSGSEFRYIEFFTHPPVRADFIEVKQIP